LLYCQAATRGGATTFSKSDIFVVPKRGQATFFAYKGLDGRMDDGSTQHSGCPVLEGKLMFLPSLLVFLSMRGVLMCVCSRDIAQTGEKWVTTLWMRDGVSEERPGTLFDPQGIPLLGDD